MQFAATPIAPSATQSAYTSFEAPRAESMGMEHIGQNWFVTLGDHILHFVEGQAKLTILKSLFMARRNNTGAVHWTDLEDALAREDFTMPRLTKLFVGRTTRLDRIAMFVEALQEELHRKTYGEWKVVKYSASNGDAYFSLRGFTSTSV